MFKTKANTRQLMEAIIGNVSEMEISSLVKENAVAKPPLPSPGRTD